MMETTTETQSSSCIKLDSFADECRKFAETYKGNQFFRAMARFIAKNTGVSYVLVGYPIQGDLNRIRTAVLYAGGKFVEKYEYDLYGTPCENVIGRNCCYYPTNIQNLFPEDKELENLNIDSYLGLPVFGSDEKPCGLLVVMDSQIIRHAGKVEEGLQALTQRVARELQKII